jgi:hypothetical protein
MATLLDSPCQFSLGFRRFVETASRKLGLEMQREAFPDMPHFIGPDEIPTMLRPSSRKDVLNIHVLSLAIIADTAEKLKQFVQSSYKRDAKIISKETRKEYCRRTKIDSRVVDDWLTARRTGAAKAGGEEKRSAPNETSGKDSPRSKIAGISRRRDRTPASRCSRRRRHRAIRRDVISASPARNGSACRKIDVTAEESLCRPVKKPI